MKRLIAITTLSLAFNFPALSFAFDHMDLYTKPVAKSEVTNEIIVNAASADLPNLGQAPELTGITKWLNTQNPLSLQQLQGKVVLVHFWTYTCINCIRTLPYVTSWYEKYKDKGFVVIGVHTPEFEFEKGTQNVERAIKQYKINYPVPQDNDYNTWRAYNNRFWPAEYLIDTKGNIRRTHFGEGEYNETEEAIKTLLRKAGATVDRSLTPIEDQTPQTSGKGGNRG
jgi:thiol-disulfide isomerase/thioredoxin